MEQEPIVTIEAIPNPPPCYREYLRVLSGGVEIGVVGTPEWVREVFAPVFARSIGGPVKWCAQWWAHGEAVLRLEALWRSWEVLPLVEIP